ncbi:MAG: sulfotransferase domain-containing protein, partial [Proteobacteria bacterium]|nr:sulfotransferase domain-containing protein [Pseudomonadota bacterium]
IMPEVTAAAICVIRNPFDVAISFARHSSISIDVSIDRMCDPANISKADSGIIEVLGRWDDHINSWMDAPGLPRHLMRYEDMVDNPKTEYKKLLKFLQVPAEYKKLQTALKQTSFSAMQKQESQHGFKERPPGMDKFFATGKYGGWVDKLTTAQIARIHTEFKPTIDKFFPEVGEQALALISKDK